MTSGSQPIIGILLNYRDARRSLRCVLSLLEEGADGVVVWDNSDDGGASARVIAAGIDPRVELVISERNLGFAAGVNAALSIMRVRWAGASALLINNDAALRVGALSKMRASADANTVVAPTIDHAGDVVGVRYSHRWFGVQAKRRFPGAFPFVSGACLLFPPELAQSPLFDEAFFMYGEDVELSWRLFRSNRWRVRIIDDVLVDHDVASSSGHGSMFYETHVAAAHWLLARRLAKGPLDCCVLYVCRGMFLVIRASIRCLRSSSLVPWRGMVSGIRQARTVHLSSLGR